MLCCFDSGTKDVRLKDTGTDVTCTVGHSMIHETEDIGFSSILQCGCRSSIRMDSEAGKAANR